MSYGSLGTIWSEIGLDYKKFDQGINVVAQKTTWLDLETQKTLHSISGKWKYMGKEISKISAPIALVGGQMMWTYAKFEQSMANTASVAGATVQELNQMTQAAREAGATTVYSASQAADALYFTASAGFDAKQSIEALDGVLNLAAATGSELAFTSESIAAAISQFSLEAEDATRIANVYAAAIANSQATMSKLSNSMRYAGPIAAGFGLSIEEITAALMQLYNAGLRGEQAGTTLRRALQELAAPTGKSARVLDQLGLSVEDVSPAFNSFTDILNTLNKAGITTTQTMELFGEAGSGMGALLRQGSGSLVKMREEITGTNSASKMAEIQMNTLQGSLKILKSVYEELSISLAEKFAPVLKDIIEYVTDVVRWFNDLDPAVQKFIVTTGTLTAVLGPAVLLFGQLMSTLPFLFGPGGLVLAGVAAVAGLTVALSDVNETTAVFYQQSLDTAKATREQADELDRLIREYENLAGKPDLSEQEHSRLQQVMQGIVDIQPTIATGYRDIKDAIESNLQPLKDYHELLKQQSDLQLETIAMQAQFDKPNLTAEKEQLENEVNSLREKLGEGYDKAIEKQQQYTEALSLYNKAIADRKNGKPYLESFAELDNYLSFQAGKGIPNYSKIPKIRAEFATNKFKEFEKEVKVYQKTYDSIFGDITQLMSRINEINEKLQAGDLAISTWDNRQNGGNDNNSLSEAFSKELDVFESKISQFKTGTKEYSAQYDELKKAYEEYITWLNDQRNNEDLSLVDLEKLEATLKSVQEEYNKLKPPTASQVDLKDEIALWESRISLVKTGKEEYQEQFGDIKQVTKDYIQWLEETLNDPALDELTKGKLADILVSLNPPSDATDVIQKESDQWKARIALVGLGVEEYKNKYGDLKNITKDYVQFLTDTLNSSDIKDDSLKARIAAELQAQKEVLETLNKPDDFISRTKRLNEVLDFYGSQSIKIKEALLKNQIPYDPIILSDPSKDFDTYLSELKPKIKAFYNELLESGQISPEDHLDVLKQQLQTIENAGQTGLPVWAQIRSEIRKTENSIKQKNDTSIREAKTAAEQELQKQKEITADKEQFDQEYQQFLIQSRQTTQQEILRQELASLEKQLEFTLKAGEDSVEIERRIQMKKFELRNQELQDQSALLQSYSTQTRVQYQNQREEIQNYITWVESTLENTNLSPSTSGDLKGSLGSAKQDLLGVTDSLLTNLERELELTQLIRVGYEELYGENVLQSSDWQMLVQQEIQYEEQIGELRAQNRLNEIELNNQSVESLRTRQAQLLELMNTEAAAGKIGSAAWNLYLDALKKTNTEINQLIQQANQFFKLMNPGAKGRFDQWFEWFDMVKAAPNAFEVLRVQMKDTFGDNLFADLFAGFQGFEMGADGGLLGQITGALAGFGVGGPWMGAISAGSVALGKFFESMISEEVIQKKDDAEALNNKIEEVSKAMEEYGVVYEGTMAKIKEQKALDLDFLWTTGYEITGEEAAQMGLEIGERMLDSMNTSFQALGSAMADAISGQSTWEDFEKVLQKQLQRIILEEVLAAAQFEEQAKLLVGMMQEAATDGYTEEEIQAIREKWRMLFGELQEDYDAISEIFDELFPNSDATVNHQVRGVQISRMSGEDRDMFKEMLTPLSVLHQLPSLLGGDDTEVYQSFQASQIGAISAQEVIIEQVILYAGDIIVNPAAGTDVDELVKEISGYAFSNTNSSGK